MITPGHDTYWDHPGRLGHAEKLAEAEWLIRNLSSHEGAEGWSKDLSERLYEYDFVTHSSNR